MATEAQIIANRHNAKKSTSPRTPLTFIMQNKPNLLKRHTNVTSTLTKDYENKPNLLKCQNKPNSNPFFPFLSPPIDFFQQSLLLAMFGYFC